MAGAASGGIGFPAIPSPCAELYIAIRIDNFDYISKFFGPRHADRMVRMVCDNLSRLSHHHRLDRAVILPGDDGCIDAVFASSTEDVAALVHACCVLAAFTPVGVGRDEIVPVLSFGLAEAGVDVHGRERDALLFRSARQQLASVEAWRPLSSRAAMRDVYAANLSRAAGLMGAVHAQAAVLAWQPVRNTDATCGILYHEALLRLVDARGHASCARDSILAVERVGCAPALDCCIVSRVLDELEAVPSARLGVNISAQSATLDFWWAEVLGRLSANRLLGSRLFIEITETASLPPINQVVEFVDRMRSFGCTVVLDNFGVGFSSIRTVMALKPDLVKIDALFVQRASESEVNMQVLRHLVSLGSVLAHAVIVEGIDTEAQAALAREAGACWQQGFHQGAPSIGRRWITDQSSGRIVALKQYRDAFRNSGRAEAVR